MILNIVNKTIFILTLIIFNALSYASDSNQADNFKNCTKHKNDNLRLACYDKITKYNSDVYINEAGKNNITTQEIEYYNNKDNKEHIYQLAKKYQSELNTINSMSFFSRLNIINVFKKAELLNHENKFLNSKNKEQFINQVYLESYTPLSKHFDLDGNDEYGLFKLRSHKSTYLMPVLFNSHPNKFPYTKTLGKAKLFPNSKKIETKIKLSFKMKLSTNLFSTPADLWFGYTQISYWQSYDKHDSAPFRETNYAPEFFITYPFKYYLPYGITLRMFGLGLIHESNGREDPLSRGWNRIYLMSGLEWKQLTIIPIIWWKIYQGKQYKQDNPDITNYKGIGKLIFIYKLPNNELFTASIHGTPFNKKKGGLRLSYNWPIKNNLKFFVQGFYGYGDNLIDYNVKTKSIGFGILLNDLYGF